MKKVDVINSIFSPKKLRGITVKNRLMRSGTNLSSSDSDGFITDSILERYRELAQGGVGLLVTGITAVHERGRAAYNQKGVWHDKHIEGLRRLSDVIHKNCVFL